MSEMPWTRDRRVASTLVVLGAATLVASAFLPQRSPTAASLFSEGTGWGFVLGGALLAVLTIRRRATRGFSWAGLWIGTLAVLNAIALGADHTFRPVGPGIVALAAGGTLVLGGWTMLAALARPRIAGVGRVRELLRVPAAPHATRARAHAQRHRAPIWLALLGYGLLSVLYWGVPVLGHFHTTLIAQNDLDPAQFTWFYSWWPHAVFHGLNPWLTRVMLAPDGYNLSWATTVPVPSMLASPLTALFGGTVTYNVLALAAPAVAAWSAFVLGRHLTGRTLPALAGGYIFGFSPYMLRTLQGSPDLFFIALIPILVLWVVRFLEGSLSERRFVVAMALTVALQFLTTVEFVATSAIFGAVALIAAFLLWVERRPAIARTVWLLALGYVAAAVLVSPVIYFMLFHPHTTPYNNGPILAADLLSWVYPDPDLAVATTHQIGGTPAYYGGMAYFTLPLLACVGLWAYERRRERVGRLLTVCFAAPALFGLGSLLWVHGHLTRIGLPWSDLAHFPGLRLLIPQRFAMYGFLAAAVIVALWLSARGGLRRWSLVLLAVVMMVPDLGSSAWKTPTSDPRFFTAGGYQGHLRPSDRVITIPIIGENMRWQAESHFGFQVVGGNLGTYPASYLRYPTFLTLLSGRLTPDYASQLRRFVADKGVTAVVIAEPAIAPTWLRLFGSLGVRPVDTGGVLLYRLR